MKTIKTSEYINYHVLIFLLNCDNATFPLINQLFSDEIDELAGTVDGVSVEIDVNKINQQIQHVIAKRKQLKK